MIDINKSVLIETFVAEAHSTAGVIEEGTALVQVLEGGKGVVRPAQGLTNEDFVGLSISRPSVPTVVATVEQRTVPSSSPYTLTLSKAINTGSGIRVTGIANDGTRTAYNAGSTTTATDYTITGNVLTFNSGAAGKNVEIAYETALSYQEAVYRYSFDVQSSAARTPIGTTGVCSTGKVLTTKFDISVDWASYTSATPIRLKAGGILTIGGNTQAIDAMVSEIPSVNGGYLGVSLGVKHNA